MTKKDFERIIKKAGISDMEHALNLICIALNHLAREDEKEFPRLSEDEREKSHIIHKELEKIGLYK